MGLLFVLILFCASRFTRRCERIHAKEQKLNESTLERCFYVAEGRSASRWSWLFRHRPPSPADDRRAAAVDDLMSFPRRECAYTGGAARRGAASQLTPQQSYVNHTAAIPHQLCRAPSALRTQEGVQLGSRATTVRRLSGRS